jgi:hypothetical protein
MRLKANAASSPIRTLAAADSSATMTELRNQRAKSWFGSLSSRCRLARLAPVG